MGDCAQSPNSGCIKVRMQYISLIILAILYLLASVRYFPGELARTALETALHVVSFAPFTIGCTMLLVIILQKMSRAKLPWDRVARLFLMMALLFEVILGLQNYLGQG